MDTQKALEILISAVKVANTKGAFSLEDSAIIAQAVTVFTAPKQEKTPETGEDLKEVKKK